MDPLQQLSEWLSRSTYHYCSIAVGDVGGEYRYRCWLYNSGEDRRAEAYGTDPKTLSDVIAEALAEILKRTQAAN